MKLVVALCLLASTTAFVPRSLGARPVVRVRSDVVEEPAVADDPEALLAQAAKLREWLSQIDPMIKSRLIPLLTPVTRAACVAPLGSQR